MVNDSLGDRMKEYEARYAPRLMPLLPTFARLDGKAFHSFTHGLKRPYDEGLLRLMRGATRELLDERRAIHGYTQSDEITLLFYTHDSRTQLYFDGKIQKMVSVLASLATSSFQDGLPGEIPSKVDYYPRPVFDCRVWQVPTLCEAANAVLWREMDATRNSLQMVARSHYSHKALIGKATPELHDLLHAKGDNWDAYPDAFKRGSHFGIRQIVDYIQHPGGPGEPVVRKEVVDLALQPLLTYTDRVKAMFDLPADCSRLTTAA